MNVTVVCVGCRERVRVTDAVGRAGDYLCLVCRSEFRVPVVRDEYRAPTYLVPVVRPRPWWKRLLGIA